MTGTLHNAQGQGPEDGIALSPSNTFEESESIVEDATNADWLKFNILSLGHPVLIHDTHLKTC